jgi:hypothetical protein
VALLARTDSACHTLPDLSCEAKGDSMLIDILSGTRIDRIPYNADFEVLRRRLSDDEFGAIVERINELIDEAGGEIATAGWLPGNDWTGTPFEPIFSKAARRDYERSALFFGQLVWYAVMNRPERWASGKYQKDGVDIRSRTYFRLRR